jgi:tRNA(Leu) C34 or U34 (ribose-2'-O)-methylase TrmL
MITLILINPKVPFNVGAALRAASVFQADRLFWTGHRVEDGREVGAAAIKGRRWRLPREERMKVYDVEWAVDQDAVERVIDEGATPICVELIPGAESLFTFEHPAGDVAYIFGPEDGSVPKGIRHRCHRFIEIPSRHCLNLAATCNVVLYDRALKESMGLVPLAEEGMGTEGVWAP